MKWTNFLVLLFSVCVVQCWAMTNHEIEDFTNFLKKTSHLGQTLKSTPHGDDESDEDEPVSDHAWEDSGKFEGDLILNDRQRRLIVEDVATGLARNGLRDSTKRWPDNEVIYYIQREHFSGDQVQAIQDGIDDLAQASCVKFRPYKKGDRDAVVIQGSRRGCFSQVGYQGGYQVLNLSGRHPVGRGCFRHGTVVHELLHTLGFYHMQSSPDRDDYIHVAWENIIQPARHNFRKYNTFSVSDFGVGYDYDSVLHYSRKAFSANGQDTIIPKNGASIGQRRGLSDKDTQKLNKMYCDADSNDHIAAGAAADDGEKDVIKKQTPKNKPFQGHGIGYHQGKTVVIKLPAAETYYLPELPKLHMFDYFSKTHQAVSPTFTKGFGIGKEISNYEYVVPPTGNYKNPIEIQSNDKTGYVEHKFTDKEISGDEKPKKDQPKDSPEHTSIQIENPHSLHKPDEVIDDAFDRLGKIIKNHVYPSQVPDLAIYKINTDYSDFYTPSKKSYNDAELKKVDSFFKTLGAAYQQKRNSPPNLPNDEHTSKEVVNDVYETIENIHNNYEELTNREETTEPNTEKEIQPIKSSFKALETFEDNKKNGHGAQQLNEFVPEFLSLKKLLKNYDYSVLYYPYSKDDSESPEKQLLRLSSTKAPDRSKLDESPLPEYLKKYNEDYKRLVHITPSYVLRDKARELYVPNVSEKLQYDPEQDKEKFFNFLHPQSKKNYYSGDALPEYGHHSYDYPYDSIYYVADDKKSKLR